MNQINFQQIGGFPLETETLLEVQKAYSIFNAYGSAIGDNCVIISGCEIIGNTVSDGFVYLNNELIAFKGGTLQSKVYVKEEIKDVEFADAELKPVYYTRYVTFGTTTNSIDWSVFKRIDPIITLMSRLDELEKTTKVFESGLGSVWWRGTTESIPTGWIEDTTMRGLVPVGYDPDYTQLGYSDRKNYRLNQLDYKGGEREHILSITEMPSHTHEQLIVNDSVDTDNVNYLDHLQNNTGNNDEDFKNHGYTGSVGGGESHNNMQPYRVGIWIKREI